MPSETNTNHSTRLGHGGVIKSTIVKDSFCFHAQIDGVHKIFLLFANASLHTDPSQIAGDILRNVKNSLCQ
jgi:hypothetical protein